MVKQESTTQGLLDALLTEAQTFLLPPKIVGERLKEIANCCFAERLSIRVTFEDQQYIWGETPDDSLKTIHTGNISSGVKFELLARASAVADADQAFLPQFGAIAKALWGDDIRPQGGLEFGRTAVQQRLTLSLTTLTSSLDDARLGVAYLDLDKFKELNTKTDHPTADRALRDVNRQLHEMTRQFGGLAFHRSGDEFYVVLPYGNLLNLLNAFRKLQVEVRRINYGQEFSQDARVGLTIGVYPTDKYDSRETLDAAVKTAEALTKDAAGEKRRGKITLGGSTTLPTGNCSVEQLLQLGTIMIRRRLATPPFADPRLNLVSMLASDSGALASGTHDESIEELLSWLGASTSKNCWEESLMHILGAPEIPEAAIALAITHGLASRQARELGSAESSPADQGAYGISYASDGSRVAVVLDGRVLWGKRQQGDSVMEVVNLHGSTKSPRRCVIGVQVGLSERPASFNGEVLPSDLFDQIILVDERPMSGGGLPDFWQPAIAQVFAVLGKHNGEAHVIVWGTTARASETYVRLSSQKDWSIDEISRVAELSSESTRSLRQSIGSNLKLVDDPRSLVTTLFSTIPVSHSTQRDEEDSTTVTRPLRGDRLARPILSRDRLPLEDGVRCRNAAQAYPIIIDVLRKGEHVRMSSDDAEQDLRELLGFKLILEQPLRDNVPAYLEDHRNELSEYAERVLLNPQGLFRKSLEESGQFRSVSTHLANYLSAPAPARSTRRACLVIPHEVPEGGEPRPMGLLNIWASPRVADEDRNLVDFVFVWRTVEAFIGLPYSLYGSTKLAEQLMSDIALTVPVSPNGKVPAVGELTYIALSLHMRVDEFHQRIAKRIVDDSSD